jgi:hypothetical protein
LRLRNGGEFSRPLDNMRVRDASLALSELTMILQHGGKPPNWV